jgi:hypothetical protein
LAGAALTPLDASAKRKGLDPKSAASRQGSYVQTSQLPRHKFPYATGPCVCREERVYTIVTICQFIYLLIYYVYVHLFLQG